MVGLKLLGYIILLSTVLVSRPGTELCFNNGSIEIVNNALNKNFSHCSENGHSKDENSQNERLKTQQNEKCCVDLKIAENQSNLAASKYSLELKFICFPAVAKNYFIELQKQFVLNKNENQFKNKLICRIIDFEHLLKNYTSYQFTSTVLLLI